MPGANDQGVLYGDDGITRLEQKKGRTWGELKSVVTASADTPDAMITAWNTRTSAAGWIMRTGWQGSIKRVILGPPNFISGGGGNYAAGHTT